jgi:hypothetical protein
MFVIPLTVAEIARHLANTNISALITTILSIIFLVGIKVLIETKMF